MPYTVADAVQGLRKSRQSFLKHLKGLKADQWDWKPYQECKSITETIAHLICDDRAALQSLQSGKEPDYDSLTEPERDRDKLLAMLDASHRELCDFITGKWSGSPLDTEVSIYGMSMPLVSGVAALSSEDLYHSGQVAFIRCATDPDWDYYTDIYGPE
ncbi:MAG TPA: DinB family protein [Armatimonadota bacterium]|jgi:uncharacterized damage-inducible protein DinB